MGNWVGMLIRNNNKIEKLALLRGHLFLNE
jgi:hypothetical protein